MRLDIDDNSLHDMLQSKKDYIGGSWINGIVNVVGGMSFAVTLYSAKISSFWLNLFLYIVAFFLIGLGFVQFLRKLGKRSYDYEKLYDDIKKLSISDSQYSLVAILNDFEGDSANKVLLKYFQGGWKTYMFLSYRSAPKNDESNVISRIAASLKIERSHLKVKFLTEIPYQPKYSPDHKLVRMYHNSILIQVMNNCINLAKDNAKNDQYPIAAIVTNQEGCVLATSSSSLRKGNDPTNHPEMEVIRKAAEILESRVLNGCYLFTTLEPCPMCTSAAIWAKMQGIAYGAYQEDAMEYIRLNPHRKFSWRQISIKSKEIIDNGYPSLELYEGILREECKRLFI